MPNITTHDNPSQIGLERQILIGVFDFSRKWFLINSGFGTAACEK
jgi:hypothetical protein